MIMTNKTELPKFIADVAEELYNSHKAPEQNEFSTTELLKGTKEILLLRRHSTEIEQDVQDTASLWTGTAVHSMVQKYAEADDVLCEKELKREVVVDGKNYYITGIFDYFNLTTHCLQDLKDCKVAGFEKARKGDDDKWFKQLCSYSYDIEDAIGTPVKKAQIIAIMTDHSKVKASLDPNYPQGAIGLISWDMESPEAIEKRAEVIKEQENKLAEVVRCSTLSDDEIPPCTPEERFEDLSWAVMKKGAKRAVKKCDTKEEAEELAKTNPDYYVEDRGGNPIKCKLYCSCNKFCSFYQDYIKREGK